jgi:DNA-binding CsgD family transcriptional regulator
MSSAILDSLHKPATAVFSALAMHRGADDFCRELALGTFSNENVLGVCLVIPTQNAQLELVGRYGPESLFESLQDLQSDIEVAIREKYQHSLRFTKFQSGLESEMTVAMVPSAPMASSSGVLTIFFNAKSDKISIDSETQVALSFACELYCSPKWNGIGGSSMGNRRGSRMGPGGVGLTSRQMKVLELIAIGKTNDRIARVLNYSVATVKNDIAAVFQFLGVNNRHDSVAEAEKRGLINQESLNDKEL